MDDDDELDVTLRPRERLVLAGLLRQIVLADHELSEEEFDMLARIPARLGITDAEWERTWSEAQRTFPDAESARAAGVGLGREEARELVYELLYRLAESDDIDDAEWDVLEWLSEAWRERYG